MGLFDFFKKNAVEPASVKIELDDDRIVINGKTVDVPSHIDALTAVLGKPRAVVYPSDPAKDLKDWGGTLPKSLEQSLTSKRVNYSWDKLGVYCYTKNGSVVFCVGIRLNKGDICPKHFPSGFFKGEIMIKGMPWIRALETLPDTADMEFFKQLELGSYSVNIEYVDFTAKASARTEKDYTTIEIQLR